MATEQARLNLLNLVWDAEMEGGPIKAVLLSLAHHADADGRNTWPSIDTMARETSVSRPTVMRALKALRLAKLIAVEKAAGKATPTRYAINVKALKERGWNPFREEEDAQRANRTPDDPPVLAGVHRTVYEA